jgi:hypothetical protein
MIKHPLQHIHPHSLPKSDLQPETQRLFQHTSTDQRWTKEPLHQSPTFTTTLFVQDIRHHRWITGSDPPVSICLALYNVSSVSKVPNHVMTSIRQSGARGSWQHGYLTSMMYQRLLRGLLVIEVCQ